MFSIYAGLPRPCTCIICAQALHVLSLCWDAWALHMYNLCSVAQTSPQSRHQGNPCGAFHCWTALLPGWKTPWRQSYQSERKGARMEKKAGGRRMSLEFQQLYIDVQIMQTVSGSVTCRKLTTAVCGINCPDAESQQTLPMSTCWTALGSYNHIPFCLVFMPLGHISHITEIGLLSRYHVGTLLTPALLWRLQNKRSEVFRSKNC